ncbi:hypothetical protein RJ639_024214, partial [Escallonia herrerae]
PPEKIELQTRQQILYITTSISGREREREREIERESMEEQGARRHRRLVLIPSPLQGHISPMLQLGAILHSKGFSITIAHAQLNSPDPSNHPDFNFLPLLDNLSGLNGSKNIIDFIATLNKNCTAPLMKCLAQVMEQQQPDDQVACIIYDNLMYISEAVANHFKLPKIVLRTSPPSYLVAYRAMSRLQAEGYFPLQDSMLQELVPELYPLRFKDLPFSNLTVEESLQLLTITGDIRTSSAIIWNTMDYLDHSAISKLQEHYHVPFFSVGPLHKLAPASSTSLLKEDTGCITWLDKQVPNSVLYVSLGSVTTIYEKELKEMAWGLANSEQPFLWVIRPGSVSGSEWVEFLPEGYMEKVGEKCCIVKWAPQKEVLAHGAVGGFWSHCGWNSTLETISEGVPTICRPFFVDQMVSARYLTFVWRVGLELEHVEREEIERAIKTLMVDKEGKEIRQRAMDMKEKVKTSLCKGGSSYNSLNGLVEFIMSFGLIGDNFGLDSSAYLALVQDSVGWWLGGERSQVVVKSWRRGPRGPCLECGARNYGEIGVTSARWAVRLRMRWRQEEAKWEREQMECQIPNRCQRLVLVPCPLQGHISPMLELGTILLSKGFSITIAHTVFNAPNPSNFPDFFFLPIFDNLSDHDTTTTNLKALGKAINTNCEAPFLKSLVRMMEENESLDQVVCIIYDVLMYFAEAVAKSMKLPSIIFRTVGACAVLALDAIPWLQAEGYLPCQVSMLQDLVPSLHPLRFKDLPISNMGSLDGVVKLAMDSRTTRSSSAIIWNTIDHLEHSSLEQLHQFYNVPLFSIGPLHKMALAKSTSLLIEDTDCIEWLDKQALLSVLYISLGSLATVDKKELAEMAWGLANSGQPFLWVVRPGSVRDSESPELLPEGFKERIGERGHLVKWAPQKEVLAHGAVRGFWSHCGWNSTLESICEGVPLICMPYFADQNVNARYLCHVWKVGLELEPELERGEIEKVVKRLMTDKEGEELRQRAGDMKEKVELCMREGGSSYKSLNDLAEFILSFQRSSLFTFQPWL